MPTAFPASSKIQKDFRDPKIPSEFLGFQKYRKSVKQISETPTGNSDLKDGVSTVVDEVASVSRVIYISFVYERNM